MTQPLLTHTSAAVAAIFLENTRLERYGLELVNGAGSTKGTIYPLLIEWERRGWLASRWENDGELAKREEPGSRRRYYSITDAGTRELTHYLARWEERRKGRRAIV